MIHWQTKKACDVVTKSWSDLKEYARTFYQEEISQWVQWNLSSNSETRLKRIKEIWGHTMTLMPLHYNLCSNLPSKEEVTGRWLMFQVTKYFKNIFRFKIHQNVLPLCYLWLHCEMRLGDSRRSNLKHEPNTWEYSKQKIWKSIILAFLNVHLNPYQSNC